MQGLIGILGGLSVFLAVLLAASALVPLALAYVALRVRDAREQVPDPRLGAKTAFHLIHSLGILLALAGLTVSIIDLMSESIAPKPPAQLGFPQRGPAPKETGFNSAQRTAVALVCVGTLFALIFFGMLLSTNDRTHRSVRRVFVGGRMALCLLVTMASVAVLAVVLAQKDPDHEVTEAVLAIGFVWVPAAIVHMILFNAATRESRSLEAGDEHWTPRV